MYGVQQWPPTHLHQTTHYSTSCKASTPRNTSDSATLGPIDRLTTRQQISIICLTSDFTHQNRTQLRAQKTTQRILFKETKDLHFATADSRWSRLTINKAVTPSKQHWVSSVAASQMERREHVLSIMSTPASSCSYCDGHTTRSPSRQTPSATAAAPHLTMKDNTPPHAELERIPLPCPSDDFTSELAATN